MKRIILVGNALEHGRYIPSEYDPRFIYMDPQGNKMAIDRCIEHMGILLIGSSGCGKTNVISQTAAQILMDAPANIRDTVSVVFDTKGDYIAHPGFFRAGDIVLGNNRMFRDRSNAWNLFSEVMADGNDPRDYEANAREIATILFEGRESKHQPFFTQAARDILSSTIIYFVRRRFENSRWIERQNNYDLAVLLRKAQVSDLYKMFQVYPDMHSLKNYLGNGDSNQALGVLGQLTTLVNDVFTGVFAMKPDDMHPDFSMRRAIRDKGGRAIFIEYDMAQGSSLTPIYRLLVDLALKEALSRQCSGRNYFFLDELKLLPMVRHLPDALNYGRAYRTCIVAGLQNINQMNDIYGESLAKSIIGGFSSVIAMRSHDVETREFVSRLFGPNLCAYSYRDAADQPVNREQAGFTVEDWDLRKLKRGDAVVGLASQDTPFLFHFDRDPFEKHV